MTEAISIAAGWSLLVAGVAIAYWWGWRDPGKGTRRCPKCWYDMTATAGLQCSECGREANAEKQLHRSNRRWRHVVLGGILVLASYPIVKWPLYLKDGPIGFVPRVVTFALLPELSEQIRLHFPRGTPRSVSLAARLAAKSELNAIERTLLARSFDRMLRMPKITAVEVQSIMRSIELLGDRAPVVMPRLAEILTDSPLSFELWPHLRRLPYDERCRALVPAVVKKTVEAPESIVYWPLLDMIRAWGATDEELRSVLLPALRSNRDDVEWRALSCMWSEQLARSEDAQELIRKGIGANHPTEVATWVMASLPPKPESILLAGEQIRTGAPANFIKACTILVAAGDLARSALPELDAASMSADESIRVAAQFTAACLRNQSKGVVESIKDLELRAGEHGSGHGILFLGLVFYSPIAETEKRDFLEWRVERDLPALQPISAPVTLELAVILLGHMGAAAMDAAPRLLELCRPGRMRPVQFAAIDAVVRIGLSNGEQAERAEEVLNEWQGQRQSSPDMRLRLEKLAEMIAKRKAVTQSHANH